ncbi:MAG: hypothetical protein WAW92_03140 [Minisyncoccia bacterium]
MIVVPAIIPISIEGMQEEIKKVSGFATLIQIDISDGIFTPVKTWPYNGVDREYFEKLKTEEEGWPKWDSIDYEVHLMIKNPEEHALEWIHTGVKTIIGHIEATEDFQKLIDICKENDVSVGVAFKPSTPIEKIKPYIDQVDFVQVMGSDKLGEHGTHLENTALDRVKELQAMCPDKIIAIDIGVNEKTRDILVSTGVDKIVSGSYILNSIDPEEEYEDLLS